MKNDRLDTLRVKYLEGINTRETEIRQLREKLKLLDEVEADSEKLSDNAPASPLKYSTTKLTKAIFDAVQTLGQNGGVSATDVRKYISANGYKHASKNFPVATVIALNRMAERGKIDSTKTDGKRLFFKKKEMK
jgi:hypothetical protein